MKKKLRSLIGMLLAAVMIVSMMPTAVTALADTYTSNVIGPIQLEKTLVASDGNTYRITLTYDRDKAGIPDNAELQVTEILQKVYENQDAGSEYDDYLTKAAGAFEEKRRVTFARFFDITIVADGQEIQPNVSVKVKIELANEELTEEETGEVTAMHFDANGGVASLDTALEKQTVTFHADEFSVYGIVGTVIEKTVLASDGKNYKVTVTYGPETEIPERAELEVEEILPRENGDASMLSAYDEYVSKTENVLGMEEGSAGYIRLFDIRIVDKDDHGVKYQPKEGTTVDVKIELADMGEDTHASVVHFDENEIATRLENTIDGDTVSFETDSFSIFAIALFDDIVENTTYMNIRVHSSVPMIKALKNAESALFEGKDVVEAYEVVPRTSLMQVTVDITSLPENNPGETFELCLMKDGSVSSLGEAALDTVFSFRADEADAFALVKSQVSSHTLTGAYGIKLSGDFPEGAYARVSETEPVELDGTLPEASFAYDIKIYDSNDEEWQPAFGETVECFVPCEGTQEELEGYYWVVLHTSDGVTEQLYDASPTDGGIRFTTGSFSTFTLRAQVTETSLIGASTVHFVDHQGNEIQGAVSETINYAYRVPYDMWSYADQLDPSIAGDYEFSRVYLQLSGMQKDFRYIYLGTNADAGQSGSGYKIYFFMNSIEESKTGGTYNGTWYTITSGTKWSDDIYIVFNHVEDVAFNKVDDDGDPVSGAGFTLYTDESCINVLTYNGSTVTATSDENGRVDFGRIPYGTYYMKETATPSGFKETGKVYMLNVNGNTSIGDIVNEDDDGSIIVKETKTVNITKKWSDGENHSNDTVTIKLFNQSTEAGSVILNAGNNWSRPITNLDPTVSYLVSETSVMSLGEDVTNGWIPTISSGTTSTSTAYYQSNGFQQGEQYVIVYNGNTALRNNSNSLSTTSVTVQNNMLTSSVNDSMLWTVASVSDDGVISLRNAGNNRYLNLNNASSTSRSWGMTTAAPQFVRYKPNNGTVQIFYRENMNEATAYYLNNVTGTSTGSGTNFTLYKKVNVRTENVTVTNRPASYPVMMQKLEYSSDTVISGTTFNLYTEDEYNNGNLGTPAYTGLTSGADGYLTADETTHIQLLAGTYYLVETQAANGYVKLSEPVKFSISRGGRFTARSADQEFTNYTYTSTVTDDETSYPLLKVPNQKKVTLTFNAEEGVNKVQLVSGEYLEMSGDGTKKLTVVIPEVTGSPIKVVGIAEDGRAVNGWTFNDETAKLTTSDTISTAIKDDTDASDTWTDRTYHVWSETEKKVTVTKEVNVLGTVGLNDIDTTAYFVVWDHAANRNVLDQNGNILVKSISIVDGVPNSTVTFDGLTSGTYSVWEVDASGNDLAAGTVVIGDDIAVSKIETRHGNDAGNRVTVDENNTTDGITVINTYNHQSDVVDWTINKQWFMEKNTVNQSDKASTATSAYPIPNGASSTLSLYRKDDLNTPVQTIVLDGNVDTAGETAAWKATFTDIPIRDNAGNLIQYIVKETAFTPEKSNEGLYIYPYTAETDHDGGTIRNAVIYGNIRIFKQFEIQPHEDISQIVENLQIKVTGPHGFSETYTFPAENNYNPNLMIGDLPAGIYHIEELNYVDLIPNRKWNPKDSFIFATIMPPEQSNLQGQNRAGEAETDVLIGTNGGSNDTVEVRIKNDYTKLDIKATKVWDDSSETHPAVELTLYKVDDNGNKTQVGEKKTIPANATGEDLIVVWEQLDQQYNYIVEETPVYGYTTGVTGNALTGFTVTNTPKQQVHLTIIKKVEGAEAAKEKTFMVTVSPVGVEDQAQIVELKPVNGEDSKTIEVPYGTYTIEELLLDAEDSSYTIEIDDYMRTTTIAIGSGNGEEAISKTVILQEETAAVTVTNSYKRKTTDVSFVKLDGDDNLKALSAEFQIEYSTDGVNYATIDNGQVTGVVDSVFTISETGVSLPLMDGYYRLTERTAPEGYHQMSGTIVFSVSEGVISLVNASDCAEYAAEIKEEVTEGEQAVQKTIGLKLYNYEKVPVSIWKTDSNKLAITTGASFVLYKADNFNDETQRPIEVNQIVTSGTTGADGILLLGELELGEYRLVETTAPNGYIPAEHAIKILVGIDGISAVQETNDSDVNYKGDDVWVAGQHDKTAQIRIWNNPGVALPETGGTGTLPYTLSGIAMMFGAALMYVFGRRRRERRFN